MYTTTLMAGQRILVTGGGFALSPSPEFLTLSVGKAAVRAMTLALFPALKERGVHVATVTVAQLVAPESSAADEVAEAFWQLHSQPPGHWTPEVAFPAVSP